jgi:hypothetical protein
MIIDFPTSHLGTPPSYYQNPRATYFIPPRRITGPGIFEGGAESI